MFHRRYNLADLHPYRSGGGGGRWVGVFLVVVLLICGGFWLLDKINA